ncbi:hypothetical protein C1G87_1346 [Dehalococcoides mccartyi]|uniref:Uncharacterized protein n=1 Tax=Dehalococcoides mccartyi TaxID=61435 RepID=A0A328EK99_9CHLR|nr:hypothetical protein C1G87_1346 [Dehalococcoides mccartyi]
MEYNVEVKLLAITPDAEIWQNKPDGFVTPAAINLAAARTGFRHASNKGTKACLSMFRPLFI